MSGQKLSSNPGDRLLGLLAAILVVTIGFAWMTGRLSPHMVDDSPSYLNYPFDSLRDALLSSRTPGYPVFLKVVDSVAGLAVVPILQWVISGLAAWGLALEVKRYGSGKWAPWAVGFSIALGCTALDHQSTIATDAMAASLGVAVIALLLCWNRTGRTWGLATAMMALAFAAIMVRPAYLSLIPFMLIAGTLLGRMSEVSWKRGIVTSVGLAVGTLACVLAWMGLRSAVVSDFGVLPFGHQNLAGVTFQLVGDEELLAVAPESRELIEQIFVVRDAASERGLELADPGGQAGMTAATMTIEARWNDLIYQAIVPAVNDRHPGDPVAAHRELAKINRAIVKEYPLRYARWLALASRRAVWGTVANWMMNPFFLAATVLVVGRGLWRAVFVRGEIRSESSEIRETPSIGDSPATGAGPALFVVAITYAVVMIGFVILTTPPLGRFADAGAILIPAWLAFRGAESFRKAAT